MPAPNFIVIGAAKCGTTSLYRYLKQHPQVFMSAVKEPNFFAFENQQPQQTFRGPGDSAKYRDTVVRWEPYLKLFEAAPPQAKAIGEASTGYIDSPVAAARIRHYLPQAKLIAILRHPVDRAFSHYVMLRSEGREPLPDFAQTVRQEEARIAQSWSPVWQYHRRGFYAAQLERYLALFPREQLRVYLYEDWNADNLAVLRDIFRFLELKEAFTPKIAQRYVVGGVPRSRAWHNFLTRPHPVKDLLRPLFPKPLADRIWLALRDRNQVRLRLDPRLRAELTETYRADILHLQDLLQRDLSHWLEG